MSGFDEDEGPKSRTGRFTLAHRGNTRVEVGEPIHVGGARPWLCAVKLLGRAPQEPDPEATQTLLVRTGRGTTPEEAQRDAMAQLTLVYGTPVGPPPSTRISQLSIADHTADPNDAPAEIASSAEPSHAVPPAAAADPPATVAPAVPSTTSAVSRWLARLFRKNRP